MQVDTLLWLIPALPFAGFLFNGLVGPRLPKPAVGAIGVAGPLGYLIHREARLRRMSVAPRAARVRAGGAA